MDTIWFFEDVNLFKLLCPHRLKEYKKTHTLNIYNKKDYIYFEEDFANNIYLIEKGKVKIGYYSEEGDEIIKAILSKGELFGEKAVLGEENRTEFAQSIENNTSICPINVNTLHDLMRNNKTLSFKVYKFIGFKIQKLERRLKLLLRKDARTRLLEFLNELCTDYGYECSQTKKTIIKHPYTQKDIASLIAISRPTLNTLLNELKKENVLDFNRNEIILLKKINENM